MTNQNSTWYWNSTSVERATHSVLTGDGLDPSPMALIKVDTDEEGWCVLTVRRICRVRAELDESVGS